MSYNEDFYKEYSEYLCENRVREVHDMVFDLFHQFLFECSRPVIDLGCGQFCEFLNYGRNISTYIGVDINADLTQNGRWGNVKLYQLNYRDNDFINNIKELTQEDFKYCDESFFISLFSSEITASPQDNQTLYESLFKEIPQMKFGLVSGFYYVSKKSHIVVEENGGIVSWQTVDNIEDRKSDIFSEMRMYVPCPSNMFGEDVVEVWRFLKKK